MSKEFKTHRQLMNHLRKKKKIECYGSFDKATLSKHGYFNVVNGYKLPFISGKNANGHVYIGNTKLEDMLMVKQFDDLLREHLLKYLTRVEEEVRTLAAYTFDEINDRGKIKWHQHEAYASNVNPQTIMRIITDSYSQVFRNKNEYRKHYIEKHKHVPTWILTKTMNFKTFIEFLEISKNPVKDSLCKLYNVVDSSGNYNHELLVGSLNWFRIIRNSCAHNERIYCMEDKDSRIRDIYFSNLPKSYTRDRNQDRLVFDSIVYMKYFLETDDYNEFLEIIHSLLIDLKDSIPSVPFERIRAKIGVKNLDHFELLKTPVKEIQYNKFSS